MSAGKEFAAVSLPDAHRQPLRRHERLLRGVSPPRRKCLRYSSARMPQGILLHKLRVFTYCEYTWLSQRSAVKTRFDPLSRTATKERSIMNIDYGLIGYWPFDENDGATVLDRSGHGNHGELINGSRARGVYGQAAALIGRDDSHVSIPSSTSLNSVADQLTVLGWVFPTVPPDGFKVLVSRQVGAVLHPDQFYLGFGPEHGAMHYKWHLSTDDNGTLREGDIYSGTPSHNRWIHLAGSYDGEVMRLYVDGSEIGTANIRGRIRVDDNPITIGGEENGPAPRVVDGELEGLVDEVRIYNRALNPEEVRAIFALESP
jgi:hypothetical protein